MICKLIFLIFALSICSSIELESSRSNETRRVKCFRVERPHNMPKHVFEKYRESAGNLTDSDRRDFWQKFQNWWKNAAEKVKQFFEKVAKFFKNLFSGNQNNKTGTESPPQPNYRNNQINNIKCIEIEETTTPSTTPPSPQPSPQPSPTTTTHASTKQTTIKTKNNPMITKLWPKTTKITTESKTQTQTDEDLVTEPTSVITTKEPQPVLIGVEDKEDTEYHRQNKTDEFADNSLANKPLVVKDAAV